MTKLTRQQRIYVAMGGALVAAVLAGLASGGLLRLGHGLAPSWGVIAGLSAILLLALFAAVPMWRRLDDMAREAHTTAFYWGGSAGLGIALLSLMALEGPHSPMVQGALLVALIQVAGYVGFWLGWWALRRARAA